MPNRRESIPPPEWNESAGFRETLLHYFNTPQAAALRTLSEVLHEHCMECGEWYKGTGSLVWHEMSAAELDVRHLAGFFAYVATERERSQLSPAEYRLANLAASAGRKLVKLADRLRDRLDNAGDAAPTPPAPPPPSPSSPPPALVAALEVVP